MKQRILAIAILIGSLSPILAKPFQPDPPTSDTVQMKPVVILGFKSKKAERKFWKDYKRVERVYPLARKAQYYMYALEKNSEGLSASEKKRMMKDAEEQIKNYLTPKLKEMSTLDGILLVKLLDRQTQKTGYSLVKDFRNGLVAWTYHKIGLVFGQNIKDRWDPKGEDKHMEKVVRYYEMSHGIIT